MNAALAVMPGAAEKGGDGFNLTYVSLGAGVQSTALLAMAVLGDHGCPKADVALFSDTGDEPEYVYEHVKVLKAWAAARGVPVHTVQYGCISDHIRMRVEGLRRRSPAIPAFVKKAPEPGFIIRDTGAAFPLYFVSVKDESPEYGTKFAATLSVKWARDNPAKAEWFRTEAQAEETAVVLRDNFMQHGARVEPYTRHDKKRGQLMRTCTEDYKIVPIQGALRQLLGRRQIRKTDGVKVRALLGISADEAIRMKPARVPWAENVYPLVDGDLTRDDCIAYIKSVGLPVPEKSACRFCPYHSDAYWTDIYTRFPAEFDRAVTFDEYIRTKMPGVRGEVFLHGSLKPLKTLPFLPERRDTQGGLKFDEDTAGNECTGTCHN